MFLRHILIQGRMEFYILIRNANKLAVQIFEKSAFSNTKEFFWSIELSISLSDQYDRRLDNKLATRNSNVRKSCIFVVLKRIWGNKTTRFL